MMTRLWPLSGASAVLFAFCVLLPADALAMRGKLDRPALAVPQDDDLSCMIEALRREEFHFVGGWFINSRTALYYAGNADDASKFLRALIACDEVEVTLKFSSRRTPREPMAPREAYQWRVEHDADTSVRHLVITLFLGDGKIILEDLQLPAWHGRPEARAGRSPTKSDDVAVGLVAPAAQPAEDLAALQGIPRPPVWLGVGMHGRRDEVMIMRVELGRGADEAGLREGDRILALDGRTVSEIQEVVDRTIRRNPGEEATLLILRGDEPRTVRVRLTEFRSSKRHSRPAEVPAVGSP